MEVLKDVVTRSRGWIFLYGVASVSWTDKIIGLFCRILSLS